MLSYRLESMDMVWYALIQIREHDHDVREHNTNWSAGGQVDDLRHSGEWVLVITPNPGGKAGIVHFPVSVPSFIDICLSDRYLPVHMIPVFGTNLRYVPWGTMHIKQFLYLMHFGCPGAILAGSTFLGISLTNVVTSYCQTYHKVIAGLGAQVCQFVL